MKYKIVKQPDEMNCGVACLAMICAYHGVDKMSLAVIREFAKTDREGNSIYSLKVAGEKLNMITKAYSAEKEELYKEPIKKPIIVHTIADGLYQHYMVLFEANEKKVVLGDPATGLVTMKMEDFEKIWTGKLITFEPTEFFMENKKYKRDFKIIIKLILKYKKYLIGLAILSAIISAISIVTSRFYQYLIDDVLPDNNLKLLAQLLLVTSGIYIFTVVMNWIKLKVTIKFNKSLDKELIINIYNRITHLPMEFFSSRTAGDLSTRFEDGDELRSIVTDFSLDFVIDFIYAIIALITILIMGGWEIIVITLLVEEVTLLIQKVFKNKMIEQGKEMIRASTEVQSFANQSFSASETIKSYNSEQLIEAKMADRYKVYQDKMYGNQQFSQIQASLMSTFSEVSNLLMLSILGILVMQGQITLGNFMYLYTLASYITAPIDYLVGIQDQIYSTNAVLERLDDVFRTTTEEELDKKKQNIDTTIEKLEFDNVTFSYGLRKPVLTNINFEVKKGESIGVIGESGCGKTTLIKLILKFYEVNEGEIRINDKNINDITSASLRRKIAYVSQNDFWFQDTIYNNLTIGKPHATKEEVEKILESVKMKKFIENKQYGLNTILEEGATNLSSGERQRLSIAKALITRPEILILDESTSNLDAETEEFIVNSLATEKDKMKIVIAHRLNTLAKCNKIIAIKDGNIVEAGTPKQLIEQKGMFYQLWNIQNQALRLEDES